jgi:hypothetical protein
MAEAPTTITLGSASYEVQLPRSFADREAINAAFAAAGKNPRRSKMAFAAALALCAPGVAALVSKGLDDHDDTLAYGSVIYDALRVSGALPKEISDAALALFPAVVDGLYPRASEVRKAEGFSGAGAPPT